MKKFARAMALIAAAVFSMTTLGAAPAQADTGVGPVPEDWGDPTFSALLANATARQSGNLPGRLGNQHVITIHIDDDDFMSGQLTDWKCPAGVVPPVTAGDPTSCKLRAAENFGYAGAGDYTYDWAPSARWVNIRMPISFTEGQQGRLSLRLKATGDPQVTWTDTDGYRESVIERNNATIVGGKFLGKPWLGMAEVNLASGFAIYNVYANGPV